MADSSQETRIKEYAKLLNNKIEDGDLLDFVTLEVKDRVLVYLNDDELDTKFERIVARIVSGGSSRRV